MGKVVKDTSVKAAASELGPRAQRTRAGLLDAMERRLERGGYPAATSTGVAEEAGVSAGTFYLYFSDRDDALATLFAQRLGDLLDGVREALAIDALLDDGLRAVLARSVDVVLHHYRRHAATFRAAILQLPSSPAIRDVYWSAHAETEEALATFLRRAQEAGKVRPADAGLLAQTLLVVVQGANHPLLLAAPRSARARAIRDELVELLHHLLAQPRA